MTKYAQSESLIKEIAKYIKEKDLSVDHSLHNMIYHKLIFQSVSPEDRKVDLTDNGTFAKWCSKERANTNTFVSPTWQYFCQFVSKDGYARASSNHIKVYVPLDAAHIERGVNELFDFLDKNNISHLSKVGKKIRFDGVVIRLTNENDLDKLLKFIESNKYIQEGLLKPNSFAYNEGNIALASDGDLSYNATVANYILLYMKKLKEENALDTANLKGFYEFVINYFAKTFVNKDQESRRRNLEQFAEDFSYVYNESIDINDQSVIDNYYFVTKLLVESSAKDYTHDKFVKHFHNMKRGIREERTIDENKINETLTFLIQTVFSMNRPGYTLGNIVGYIETGDPTCLTRTNNCRQTVCSSSFREDIKYLLAKKNMTARNYVMMIYSKMYSLDEKTMDLLREFMAYGDYKYGREDAKNQLVSFITEGNEAYITRDNGFRDRFRTMKVYDGIRMYMKTTGETVDSIVEQAIPRRK